MYLNRYLCPFPYFLDFKALLLNDHFKKNAIPRLGPNAHALFSNGVYVGPGRDGACDDDSFLPDLDEQHLGGIIYEYVL